MTLCLDTNVLVSLYFEDAHSQKIDAWLKEKPRDLVVSRWAETEFAAIVTKRTRVGALTAEAAQEVMAAFDTWVAVRARRLESTPAVGILAASLARDHALKLSAADALHLALSSEGKHALVTFDVRLVEAALARGDLLETI